MKVQPRMRARDKPLAQSQHLVCLAEPQHFESLTCSGYTTLADNPEVTAGVSTIARLVGAMTIHLMRKTAEGDIRERGELSTLVDIAPNRYMSRSNLIQWLVRTLYLEGRGNAVLFPRTQGGRLRELIPIPASYTAFVPEGLWCYRVSIAGREYDPGNVLHFAVNPGSFYPWLGTGYTVTLLDVANTLKQAGATKKGFMSSQYKPSLIVKVDGLVDEMGNPMGRQQLLEDYFDTNEAGQPWVIPAEQFEVQQVKPLTLADLALADFVKLDKQTVATILGVPSFVLGVGEFKRDEWNNFVSTTIMPLAQIIEQELTRKILGSGDLFFRFNSRSLLNYSMDELVKAGSAMVDRMALRRNEWRDWMGLPPDPDMDELLALENYIPADKLGDQSKLTGGAS